MPARWSPPSNGSAAPGWTGLRRSTSPTPRIRPGCWSPTAMSTACSRPGRLISTVLSTTRSRGSERSSCTDLRRTSDRSPADPAALRHGAMTDWDERYGASGESLWSGRANGVLVGELAGRATGRALDVGCGEGGDAIWLARAGWGGTGVDVSAGGVERAATAAAGVTVRWICADVATLAPSAGGYDLVSVHYPALRHAPGDPAIRALLA